VAHGLNHRLVDHPETVRQWMSGDVNNPNSRGAYLRQRPELTEEDFGFKQIEKKLLSGELGGFSRSPNTYAAVLVMLAMVAAGVAAQRVSDRDGLLGVVPIVAMAPGAAFVLYHTHSLTAAVTVVLGLGMLGALAVKPVRGWLAGHSRLAYGAGVGLFVLGCAALVGHGVYHNSLFIQTLTFRWYYWRGAAGMTADHPLLGVGWGNFGLYYPRYRLPLGVEEVKDPHNLFVRGFAELGLAGGALFIAFALWIWWALSRPVLPSQAAGPTVTQRDGRSAGGAWLIGIPLLAGVLHLAVAHDWDYPNASWLFLGAMASVGYTLLLVLGLAVVALRGISPVRLDERPGPWLLYGVIVGLGVFFLHNLIDFSLFETGPMFMFAVLAGSALGLRQPSLAGRPKRTWAAIGVFSAASLLWVIAFGAVWLPTLLAEGLARSGDALVRNSAREGSGGVDAARLSVAPTYYQLAGERLAINSQYAARAASAAQMAGNPSDLFVRGMIERAIRTNPEEVKHRLQLARYLMSREPPDALAVKGAYEQALALDPRSVSIHLEYAEALEKVGDRELAVDRYRYALRLDDALPEREVRRLPRAKREQVEKKVAELSGAPGVE
jgi:O-antigen ligase